MKTFDEIYEYLNLDPHSRNAVEPLKKLVNDILAQLPVTYADTEVVETKVKPV
jgi:hypothetical protein